MSAVSIKTEVLPGNRIEVSVPDMKVGDVVEVTVHPARYEEQMRRRRAEILEQIGALRPFKTSVEEMLRSVEEDRDSWDF